MLKDFICKGIYRGNIVAVKHIHKRTVDITRGIRKELKQIREVCHLEKKNYLTIDKLSFSYVTKTL